MSYSISLSMVKPVVAPVVNLCATDTSGRLVSFINRSCQRLLLGDGRSGSGKWEGCYGKYRVCVNNACLTWPRDISTIEAWAIDSVPGDIRNEFYEFLQMGPGLLKDCGCIRSLINDGTAPTFDEVVGDNKKLAIKCDVTEDAAAGIILRFYRNDSKEKVRTEYPAAGTWIEGERIVLPATGNYALTTNDCMAGGLYQVVKPRTKGVVRLYEYDTIAGTYKPLAYYEPSEEVPVYRQSRIPGLGSTTSTGTCNKCTVTVIAKFRFIPVYEDNDLVQIPHLDAIRLGAQAVFLEETYKPEEAMKYWSIAFTALQAQLSSHIGAGVSIPMKMVNSSTFGGGIRAMR